MSSLPARMKKIKLKFEGARLFTDFSHYKSMGNFSRRSRAANSAVHSLICSNFELVQNFMVVLLACLNEENPIKYRGTRVFTTLYIGVGGGILPKF